MSARVALTLVALAWVAGGSRSPPASIESVVLHGHTQMLHVYGPTAGDPIVISSGDGGWLHLAPHVASMLGAHGFFVLGFDVKRYLSSVTSGGTTLHPEDEPPDYRHLAEFATRVTGKTPVLLGISEGAGLSVLAATDLKTKAAVAGVVVLGLPDLNELGWRWSDAMIYLTHRTPNEPTFSTAAIVDKVAPIPLAAIHSTRDEFVPAAEIERILERAGDPKKLWTIRASDHRFSNNLVQLDQRLLEAIEWVAQNSPR